MAETRSSTSTIDEEVGQFGLQDVDTEAFFHSKEGLEIIAKFVEKMKEDIAEQEELAFLRAEEEHMKQAALAALALDIEGAKEEWKEWQEGGEKYHSDSLTHLTDHTESSREHLDHLDVDLQQADLMGLEQEREKAHRRYDQYGKNIQEADDFIAKLNPKDKQQTVEAVQAKLDKLAKEIDAESDAVRQLVDSGKYEEARSRLEHLNAKNLQMGTLKDMMSVTKGDKEMYNNRGEKVALFQEADFIIPSDKKLVKDGGEFYLLGKDDLLTDENREVAKEAFRRAQPEMSSVKNLVSRNQGIEMEALVAKASRLQAEISEQQVSSVTAKPAPTAAPPQLSMGSSALQPMPDSPQALPPLSHLDDHDPEHQHLTKPG